MGLSFQFLNKSFFSGHFHYFLILPLAKSIIKIPKNPRGCYFLSHNIFPVCIYTTTSVRKSNALPIDNVIIVYLIRRKKIKLIVILLNGDSFIFSPIPERKRVIFPSSSKRDISDLFLLCWMSLEKRYNPSKRSVSEVMLVKVFGNSLEVDKVIFSRTRISFN